MNGPPVTQYTLLSGVTSVSTGTTFDTETLEHPTRNYLASITGSGTISSTVLVEVSNDNRGWFTLATFSLAGAGSDAAGVVGDDSWQYVRGRVTAISGTGATVRLTMGG